MNHYVYITFNNSNKDYYIGGHSTELNPHLDKYMGSGTRFNEEYKKDKTVWDKYILSEHETVEAMRAAEYEAIAGHIGNGKCLNIRLHTNRAGYGYEHTDEAKEKISLALIGKKHTEESKEKMRLVNLGKKHTEEAKEKIRSGMLGNKHNLGKKLTEETKTKMSLSNIGKKFTAEHKEKLRLAKLGKKLGPMSEEHKANLKLAWIKRKERKNAENNIVD